MKGAGMLINEKDGLKGEPGRYYDYITAANGVFIKAQNAFLEVCLPVAPFEKEINILAPLEPGIKLINGKIPLRLINVMQDVLIAMIPWEAYAAIVWRDGYSLSLPEQSGGESKISYQPLTDVVLEMHSHPGLPPAFSRDDDLDEQGLKIYGLLSINYNKFPVEPVFRVGAYGHYFYWPWDDRFEFIEREGEDGIMPTG
uniref:Putative prokaryotic JAB domain contining protein n=1 Tax=viral metagenome TaxID=1070528 RepID=A0A6M3KRE7_9ZZZZ